MGRVIVVSGLLRYDSGKTYLTISLGKALRSLGYTLTVFKPVAAHSAWFQHQVFTEATALGVLVGEDVVNYLREGLIDNVDVQNPVDILTAPPDISQFSTVSTYMNAMESSIAQAVLARISVMGRRYYLIRENLARVPNPLKREIVNSLKKFGEFQEANIQWLLNRLSSREIGSYLLSLAKDLASKSDYLLVESFNDALLPVISLADIVDAVIISTPGKGLLYGKGRLDSYLRAAVESSRMNARDLVALLKPDAVVDILPTDVYGGAISRDEVNRILEVIE